MLIKSSFFRLACTFCLVLSISVMAFADTIRLKDGSIIKGKITNFSGGKFVVSVGEGSRQRQMSFFADEIESIQFDSPQTPSETIKISNPNQTSTNPNNTVITVGQNGKSYPQTSSPKVVTTDNTTTITASTPNASTNPPVTPTAAKPIELNLKVLSDNTANGWTNSGWVVRKGQRIRIVGGGRVSLGNGRYTTASGISSLPDTDKLLKSAATGALIAVIGDDNNDFIYVGGEREFIAERDGALFLGVNEGNLDDNSGAFDVKVEISTAIGN